VPISPCESQSFHHQHADHSGGNESARQEFKLRTGHDLQIYGDGVTDQSPGITKSVADDDVLTVGALRIRVIQTPCHTRGSLCYHVTVDPALVASSGASDEKSSEVLAHPGALFTGDTLFPGGVGAFFEGDSTHMIRVFQRLMSLNLAPETHIYAGHDYALNFYPNALSRDKNNQHIPRLLAWAEGCKAAGKPAMPTTFGDELETNLFLRVVSHTAAMGALYPEWESQKGDLADLLSRVYDTV
jgi:hydroxyacylglutathione hydrolase